MRFAVYLKRYNWNQKEKKWKYYSYDSYIMVMWSKDFNRALEQIIYDFYDDSYQSLRYDFKNQDKFDNYTEYLKHKLAVYGNKDIWSTDEYQTEIGFVESDYSDDETYNRFKNNNKNNLAAALISEIEKTKHLMSLNKRKCCKGYFDNKLKLLGKELSEQGIDEYTIKCI